MKKIYLLLMPVLLVLTEISSALAVTSGTYTIGAGGDFPDLAIAVSDLNGSTITGPVTFNILPGSYTGSGWQVKIGKITGASATNRVVIQSQPGNSVTITNAGSSTDNYIINLDSANYVTIKDIDISNTSSTNGRVIDIGGNSSNCTIDGCVLTTATGSATSNASSVVYVHSNVSDLNIKGNTLENGYAGVFLAGVSTTLLAENNIIRDNIITNTYKYFIYTQYAGNLKVIGNTGTATSTSFSHGLYFDYNQNGGEVSGNTISLVTTSGTHYGIYNNYVNSSSATVTIVNNNDVLVKGTTATMNALYNSNSSYISFSNNKFEANVTTGKTYTPTVAYGGTHITATNNTFISKVTSGSINATSDYRFISNGSTGSPNNIVVRENIFDVSATSGTIGYSSSGSYFMYYPNGCVINKNEFNFSRSSSGTMYGWGGYYFAYYGTNTKMDSNKITINYASGGTMYNLCYYYGFYYGADNSFSNDTINIVSKNAATYGLGRYFSYRGDRLKVDNNVVTVNNTSNSGTIYTPYYFAYYVNKGEFLNNSFTINSGSGSIYSPYIMKYYTTGTEVANNTFNVNATSATIYSPYYCNYYGSASRQHHNTFNINATSGTAYCPYYLNAYGSTDTVEYNTWNVNKTSGTITASNYYLANLSRNNTWNISSGSATTNFQFSYPQGGVFENNNVNITSTSGTIYGAYTYGGSSSYNLGLYNNKFDLKSTTGTIYGIYNYYYPGNYKFIGNVISTKTAGSSYLYYTSYGYYGDQLLVNNTFHSSSTGSTNQLYRQSGGSSSYSGRAYLYNNIFSSTSAISGNAFDVNDTTYFKSDYNLYYAPGTFTMKAGGSVATIATSIEDWRSGIGLDNNSLFRDPGFINASVGDLRPDPSKAESWAVQGRGIHIDKDTMDILGNPRAKDRFEGVPDIGAYEFTPTSIPENAVAIPSVPAANSTQVFIYGGDTVCSIDWGSTIPSSISVKQYTGVQAAVTPGITERMYFYVDVQTPVGVYEYKPNIRYKDHWLGNISNETNARIAKSSNGGLWAGYNYNNGVTDSIHNYLMPKDDFDSLSSKFTGVENARIGIRCVVPPTGLSHSAVTAFYATETWEPIFSPYGYQLIVDSIQSPLDMTKIQFTSVNTPPTYPISGLTENTTYYVNIRTICGLKDTSDWSVDSFRTMITCHAPTVHATSITDRQAVIYWDTVQTSISYEYTVDESPNAPGFGTTIFTNTTFASGLNPGTKYYAHVRSHCSTIYDISDWTNYEFNTLWPAGIEDLNGAAGITVFPNPSKNVLNINLIKTPGNGASITIADITGKVVYSSGITSTKQQVNLEPMPSGVYTLKYIDNDRTEVIKITKE